MTTEREQIARPPLPGDVVIHAASGLFVVERLLVTLAIQLALAAVLIASGHGLWALASLGVPLAVTRVPCRCRVDGDVLEVSWAFLRRRLRFDALESLRVVADPRRWVLGTRRPALALEFRDERPGILLFAAEPELQALRDAFEAARAIPQQG
jgi:hypothetical protein